jgi:hypothetical protein
MVREMPDRLQKGLQFTEWGGGVHFQILTSRAGEQYQLNEFRLVKLEYLYCCTYTAKYNTVKAGRAQLVWRLGYELEDREAGFVSW